MTDTEGLLVFTSTRVEERFLECLGCTRVANTRSTFVLNHRVQKYTMRGVVYNETVIRTGDVMERAQRLGQRLGGVRVYVVDVPPPASGGGRNTNLVTVNTVQDVITHFQLTLTASQCNTLKEMFEHQPQTLRNMVNPETPGDAETEFANRFFGALSRGQPMRAPDADLFQGNTAVFLLQGGERFAIVHDDEDVDFRIAQELSMREDFVPPPEAGERKRPRRNTPAAWQSVLKDAEPITPGSASCITCHAHRASICFDCGHQVMCDQCVRQMCELPGVRVACPVCRCETECILRPVTSEVAKE